MVAGHRLIPFVSALILGVVLPTMVRAEPSLVRIEYVVPTNQQYQKIYERSKDIRLLERASEFLKLFRLLRPLDLRNVECDGDPNTYMRMVLFRFVTNIFNTWRILPEARTAAEG